MKGRGCTSANTRLGDALQEIARLRLEIDFLTSRITELEDGNAVASARYEQRIRRLEKVTD